MKRIQRIQHQLILTDDAHVRNIVMIAAGIQNAGIQNVSMVANLAIDIYQEILSKLSKEDGKP